MAHSIGIDIGAFRLTLTRRQTFVAGFAAVCLIAYLMVGVGQSVVRSPSVHPAASYDPAQAAHCSQFIDLARAKFGPEWKRRLDPRDTLCAEQVQAAWERDWQPRQETPPEPVLRPQITASTAPPSKIAPAQEVPAHGSKTYVLAAVEDADASAAKPAGQDVSAAKPAHQETSAAKPADQDTSAAKPARQDTSAAKPARQDTSTANSADQDASAADPAGQGHATDSSHNSEYGDPSDNAVEDGDQDAMVADEHGQDGHAFSPSDDPDDETRTLNDEQSGRRVRYDDDDDVEPPPYDDSEVYEDDSGVDEDDDAGDVTPR
jgi:hypothetical protein